MTLLTKENIFLFKNIEEINDGFRIPDQAYIHGKDFECFEQLGSDGYFSNYWYGDKILATVFAEKVAAYFKEKYNNILKEDGHYDFFGMVVIWHIDDKALVANINLDDKLAFFNHKSYIPKELAADLKESKLKHLLKDDNDNSCNDLLYIKCTNKVINNLLSCVAEDFKESFISCAEDEGIKFDNIY